MITLLFVLSLLPADVPVQVSTATAQYSAALQELEMKKKGASLQKVFEAAIAAEKALGANVVETLDESELGALQQALPALRLATGRAAEIDGRFFSTLAAKHGNAADIDFFRAWEAAYPAGTAGCTAFATLSDRYKSWFAFARKHKSAYRALLMDEIVRTEEEITKSTCACEEQDDVRQALAGLARDFPTSKITQRVRQRAHDIDRGVSDIRFGCQP